MSGPIEPTSDGLEEIELTENQLHPKEDVAAQSDASPHPTPTRQSPPRTPTCMSPTSRHDLSATSERGIESFDWSRQGSCVGLGSLALHSQIKKELSDPDVSKNLRAQLLMQWASCALIGLCTGVVAAGIITGQHEIVHYKFKAVQSLLSDGHKGQAYACYLGIGTACTLGAALLTSLLEPLSGGSGIPDVKSYLNGNFYPGLLRFRTLVCRVIGLTLSTASGLYVGKEGPVVHIGSIIASGVTQGRSKLANCSAAVTRPLRSDALKVSFISVGAATGVAAAFGAPIGGVLFSIEEASSYWSHELTWQAFFAACVASFTIRAVASGFEEDVDSNGFIEYPKSSNTGYDWWEIPIFMCIGALGGIIGAAFCNFALIVQPLRNRFFELGNEAKRRKYARIFEALALILITCSIQFCLPMLFPCEDRPANSNLKDNQGRFDCPSGQYNKMALLLFDGQEGTVHALFSASDNGEFSYETLAIFLAIVFVLTGCTFGAALPSGLFVPNIVMGCTFGRFVGIFVNDYIHEINPGNYALIGAAAQLAGFSRMTISLTVIVVELTNEMTYLLPIMMTITVSQWVGNLFTISMYDIVIYMRKIPYLPPLLPPQVDTLVAEDVMTPAAQVVTFGPVVQVRELVRKLVLGGVNAQSHNGYPVVQEYEAWNGDKKNLVVGTITRAQIVSLIQQRAWLKGTFVASRNTALISPRSMGTVARGPVIKVRFKPSPSTGDLELSDRLEMSDRPQVVEAPPGDTSGTLQQRDSGVNMSVLDCSKTFSAAELEELTAPESNADGSTLQVELSEDEMDQFLDLTMFMDASPVTVYRRTPFRRMYRIFLQMGMRHMCVVGEDSSLLGLLTRKDLWQHAQICLTDSCIRFNMRSGF